MIIPLLAWSTFSLGLSLNLSDGSKYDEVVKELYNGRTYSYTVDPSQCSLQSGEALSGSRYSNVIENWELFYDKRFGPKPYFAVSTEQLMYDTAGNGIPYYRLTTLRVYNDDSATFTHEIVDPLVVNWNQTSSTVYKCSLSDEKQVIFQLRGGEVNQLCSSEALAQSLKDGNRVRYVTEYAKCLIDSEQGMGATGGSALDPYYDITYSQGSDFHLIWNRRTLIKNYQGSGYVYDTVIGDYSSIDQVASITASDILTTSYEEEYIETFTCSLDCAVRAMRVYEEKS
jgi:hypothetical protein